MGAKALPAKSKDAKDKDEEEDAKANNDTGRLITSLRPYQGAHPLTYPYLSEFVSGIVAGRVEIKKIPALPQIKMRTKKNEQAVVDKRRRAAERKKREEEQRMGGIRDETAGAFGGD